ncbi:MAG: hypothetical protein KDD58_06430 [Bdellovibrionales bacterium]|nr:hypothetical protein [Bdellovibrionales bacterium]
MRAIHKNLLLLFVLSSVVIACSTQRKKVGLGMLGGAFVGAAVGYQFVHHGKNKEYETRNTIITSIVFALVTGGILDWHYRGLEEQEVEISGRYSRYRLCDPEELQSELTKQFTQNDVSSGIVYWFKENQIGRLAIYLDDNNKWIYPVFRKRFLPPERQEDQVLSKRYIWEIIKPGSFVTRTQNPEYFAQEAEDK